MTEREWCVCVCVCVCVCSYACTHTHTVYKLHIIERAGGKRTCNQARTHTGRIL